MVNVPNQNRVRRQLQEHADTLYQRQDDVPVLRDAQLDSDDPEDSESDDDLMGVYHDNYENHGIAPGLQNDDEESIQPSDSEEELPDIQKAQGNAPRTLKQLRAQNALAQVEQNTQNTQNTQDSQTLRSGHALEDSPADSNQSTPNATPDDSQNDTNDDSQQNTAEGSPDSALGTSQDTTQEDTQDSDLIESNIERLVNIRRVSNGFKYHIKFRTRKSPKWVHSNFIKPPQELIDRVLQTRTLQGKARKKRRWNVI